ncbi:hypothetical protein EV182_000235 [Spiromyces aspiralis]|uniref:Uncharacterized protein n=1 Tax=Spiromyces aspiralis TaxID=68401 RepID=A0ACC1HW90_9FUNG|nr:hypothetical protein EV182_000235 [Spiromyces aspiralis]
MDRSRYLDINGHEQHSSGHYPYYDNAEARSRAIAKTTDKDLDDAYHQPAPSSVPDSTNSERRITLKPRPVPKNIKKRLGIFNKGKLGKITHRTS